MSRNIYLNINIYVYFGVCFCLNPLIGIYLENFVKCTYMFKLYKSPQLKNVPVSLSAFHPSIRWLILIVNNQTKMHRFSTFLYVACILFYIYAKLTHCAALNPLQNQPKRPFLTYMFLCCFALDFIHCKISLKSFVFNIPVFVCFLTVYPVLCPV